MKKLFIPLIIAFLGFSSLDLNAWGRYNNCCYNSCSSCYGYYGCGCSSCGCNSCY